MSQLIGAITAIIVLAMLGYFFLRLFQMGDDGWSSGPSKAERRRAMETARLLDEAATELTRFLDPLDEPNRENTKELLARMRKHSGLLYRELEN